MRRLIFMGTPDFAVPTLEKLVESGYDIAAVFCQPDKPKGRGHKLCAPPVKETALKNNIKVYQPETLRSDEVTKLIESLRPQAIIVAAYGKMLPKAVLDIPEYGCINVHGSLLPKYRGAAPIQWAVLNGEKVTGVTTMYMGEGMDTGDMLLKRETEIGDNETAAQLFVRLADIGAQLLLETLEKIDSIVPEKQNENQATYTKMIDKSMCRIDWNDSSQNIHNKVRALAEWPVALTDYKGRMIKIHSGKPSDSTAEPAGTIISNDREFTVACGGGSSYKIEILQLEGKKRMSAEAFLLGHSIEKGERLG